MPDPDHAPLHYRLDDLSIDVARQQVVRDGGHALDVSGLSFRLLLYLLRHGTQVLGFDALIQGVWSPAHVGEETVTQRVRLLRHALGDDGRQPRYIRSVRGQGYQLCSEPIVDTPVVATALRNRRGVVPGLISVVVATAVSLAWWRWPSTSDAPASPLLQRAAYYAAIGQPDNNERAIALYRQRLQEFPDDADAQLGLSRALSARLCLYNGSPADARDGLALAGAVIAREPRRAAAHSALGYAQDCRGDIAAALAGYERAVALDPAADASRASAAYLYERRGRLADALAANRAVRAPDTVRFLQLQLASNLALLGYAGEAEARYRRSFQLFPDNVFSNLAWPTFLQRQGRTAEATAALQQAFARGTEHPGLHLLAAELALADGDLAAARAASLRAHALMPQASLPTTFTWITGAATPPTADALRAQAATLLSGLQRGADSMDGIDAALLLDLSGDRAAALSAVQTAIRAGYLDAAWLRVSPLFAGLREERAFAEVVGGIDTHIARERQRARAAGDLPTGEASVTATP